MQQAEAVVEGYEIYTGNLGDESSDVITTGVWVDYAEFLELEGKDFIYAKGKQISMLFVSLRELRSMQRFEASRYLEQHEVKSYLEVSR